MVLGLTGSTGALGGMVARLIAARAGGLELRLLVRDPARAPDLEAAVRVCDYADAGASRSALDGVDTLFMVSAAEAADRRDQHRTFIRAAAEAGVRHVVYTSFVGAHPAATFTLGRDHFDAERALEESGMVTTLLRDNFYLDVLPLFADAQGVIRGPAGSGRVAAVARADVADVAAEVLLSPSDHAGEVYRLTGAEALSMEEVAGRSSRVLGRELTFADQTTEEAYASRRAEHPDAPGFLLDAWVSTYTAIADGSCAEVTGDVRRVVGRDPRALEAALRG